MKKLFLLFICVLVSVYSFAQIKQSTYKISSYPSPKSIIRTTAKLKVTFIGPTKQPVKSHVKMLLNKDTIVPTINEKGVYITHLDSGIYNLKFMVPFWYDVVIDNLKCGENEDINITVYFEPKEIKISGHQ